MKRQQGSKARGRRSHLANHCYARMFKASTMATRKGVPKVWMWDVTLKIDDYYNDLLQLNACRSREKNGSIGNEWHGHELLLSCQARSPISSLVTSQMIPQQPCLGIASISTEWGVQGVIHRFLSHFSPYLYAISDHRSCRDANRSRHFPVNSIMFVEGFT